MTQQARSYSWSAGTVDVLLNIKDGWQRGRCGRATERKTWDVGVGRRDQCMRRRIWRQKERTRSRRMKEEMRQDTCSGGIKKCVEMQRQECEGKISK